LRIGWSEGAGPFRDPNNPNKVRARGIGVIIKGMSAFPSSAVAKLNTDGSLNILTGSVEMGQGALTSLAQIAADESTLPVSRVRISTPDTAVTPWDQMSAASRTTNNMGKAIRFAVVDVKKQLLDMASQRLEISVDDLDVADGMVMPKGSPDKALPFAALLGPARIGNLLGRGTFQAVAHLDMDGQGIGSPQWHPAVCAAEVEVDLETGRSRILRMHLAMYVGRMINPLQCELQVEGAATFGIGQVLFEEILWDESGNLTNPNLSDYMIPSIRDLPLSLKETILETDTTEVHGIGETGLPTVAPAVGNAINRAIGVTPDGRISSLPFTPEKVLRAARSDA